MRSIIQYFINNSLAANLLMVALLIFGTFGALNIKRSYFPELPEKIILIQSVYPGASPEEVEEGIVSKVEEAVKSVSGIDRITSKSVENIGTITIEIAENQDIDEILTDVKNAVDAIASFPVGMENIRVYKQEIILTASTYSISGNMDLYALKKYARNIEDDLLATDGISKVTLKGFPEEEIEIAFRENDLRTYGISLAQAAQAVRGANLNTTSGTIKGEKEDLLLRANNKGYTANEFRNIVVKTSPSGSLIRLHQVADIKDKWIDNPSRTYVDNQPAATIAVQYTKDEDIIKVADKATAYFEKFTQTHPNIQVTKLTDESELIRARLELLTENGIMGFLLVVVFLAMFLNWRLAFWVAVAIPISFAGMFIFTFSLGDSLNVVSCFGMIMVLGILVDDGIVICESIYSKYEEGAGSRLEAAVQGTLEVLPAVTGAIITTMIAFSSFFFLNGQIGDFFSSLATFVVFALLFSLVEGALILPAHVAHSKALDPNNKKNWLTQKLDDFMKFLRDKIYGPVLQFTLANKFFVFSIMLGTLMISLAAVRGGMVRQDFFPNVEGNNVVVRVQFPAGANEELTLATLNKIEQVALEVSKEISKEYMADTVSIVKHTIKEVGPSSYEGLVNIVLIDAERRVEIGERIISGLIRDRLGVIPEAESLTFGGRTSNFGRAVSLALVSNNSAQLAAATQEVKQFMQTLEELKDVTDSNKEGLKEVAINLNEKGKFLGLNLQEVAGQVRQGYFGNEVQRIQRGNDEVKVWVRYAEKDRRNIAQLRDMRIRLANGIEYPLSEIATLEIQKGVLAIDRLEGKRKISVEADVSSNAVSAQDMNTSLKEETIPTILAKYPEVSALFEGQDREQAKTAASSAKVYPVVFLLMFFVIALTFKSISQTIAVFLLIPFCYVGVVWGHYIMDIPISLLSNQGILALIGILVNDALVFVSTYNQNLKKGWEQMEALYQAGLSRFRPITLTSITTVAGLFPLLANNSIGAQFVIPMAVSVAFGLIFITAVILILLPIYLILINRIKVYALWLWNGEKPSFESVERAVKETWTPAH